MRIIGAIFSVLLFSNFSYATPEFVAGDCKPMTWPYSGELKNRDLGKILKSAKRSAVLQFYIGELTKPKNPKIALQLASFLENTEPDGYMKGYFQVLELGATGGLSQKRTPLKLSEVCQYFTKTLKATTIVAGSQ